MGDVEKTALEILIDLVPASTPQTAVLKVLGKISVARVNAFFDRQREQALEQFLGYLAEEVGDVRQLLSDPWLHTPEGQRFWEKVFGAAIDSKLAEKRRLFAVALINGIVGKDEINELDRLRFVDLSIRLSSASLVKLASIHKACEPMLLQTKHPDWESVPISSGSGTPGKIGASAVHSPDRSIHFDDASTRELKSSGLFGRVRWEPKMDGRLSAASSTVGEDNFYTCYTQAFARFISAPAQEQQPKGGLRPR